MVARLLLALSLVLFLIAGLGSEHWLISVNGADLFGLVSFGLAAFVAAHFA